MPVDEKKLGGYILERGSILLPGALLFIAYYVFAGNQWLVGPFALALAAAYQIKGWDGRPMLAWGIGALALAALIIGAALWTANIIAIAGYWLCLAGILRMGSESMRGPLAEKAEGEGAGKTGGLNKGGMKGGKENRKGGRLSG